MKSHLSIFDCSIIAITPFEKPDKKLFLKLLSTNVFPVLDIGYCWKEGFDEIVSLMKACSSKPVGIRIPENSGFDPAILSEYPSSIKAIIYASPSAIRKIPGIVSVCEVISMEEINEASHNGADGLILKGNEAGGRVGRLSSFLFIQNASGKTELPYWIKGGMGPNGAAAAVFSGARGVVYDSQLAGFGSAWSDESLSRILAALNGSETSIIEGYRFINHKMFGSGLLDKISEKEELFELLKSGQHADLCLAGSDIIFAKLFRDLYQNPETLFYVTEETIKGNIRLASACPGIYKHSPFAASLGIDYPVIQGPMTRVSDVPGFAEKVAQNGALPSLALAVLTPEKIRPLLQETSQRLKDQPWAVGILGFLPPAFLNEQIAAVLESSARIAVLAGGRSDQYQLLKKNGITPFVHCPTYQLLHQFIKDKVKHFVFEGRECGGHVGPLSSMVLWESQILSLLEQDQPDQYHIVFAGGIHNTVSSNLISVLAAQLSARGVRVGILAGTAYLFTKEIVETGALLPKYQELALQCEGTAEVITGPGHVTRAINTPYVTFIRNEYIRMKAGGMTREEIFIGLEKLNEGHLRIASKGIKRKGDTYISVDENQQEQEGMYMIGDVAALKKELYSIDELHRSLTDISIFSAKKDSTVKKVKPGDDTRACDIAIVGMACRFAQSENKDEFWSHIMEGRDLITEVPEERWNKEIYFDGQAVGAAKEKTYSKMGGFISEFEFDPLQFGIPPQVLSFIDVSQIASLKITQEALEDARLGEGFDKSKASVIFGYEPGSDIAGAYTFRIFANQFFKDNPSERDKFKESFPELTEDSFAGILGNIVSGRVANRLDFGGQNFTIDAACASSLAAVDAAVKELVYGESDLVVAGGIDFHNSIHDYIMFCSTYALSRKGRCATFSEEADGIVLGEGMGAIVLKRYADAVADGNKIYAVIKGIAGSSDGKSLGLTAPRKWGQQKAIIRACSRANIYPDEIGLVEAHGTGTVVGDKIELAALEDIYLQAGARRSSVAIGSVKSQIGHTKCVSGIASVIKCALSVQHGVIPPTLHVKKPNNIYKEEISPFFINDKTKPWFETTRKTAISSFGFGGTNYHAIMEYPGHLPVQVSAVRDAELFLFCGKDMATASEKLLKLKTFIEQSDKKPALARLSYTSYKNLAGKEAVQIAIVATSLDDLLRKIDLALEEKESLTGCYLAKDKLKISPCEIAFLFSGQGSQFIHMGRELYNYFPALRKYIPGWLQPIWFPPSSYSENIKKSQAGRMNDTRVAQPALGALNITVARLLTEFGIAAEMAGGHSYGELCALCYAGAFTEEQLIELSAYRAEVIVKNTRNEGRMLAVESTPAEICGLIGDLKEVYIANVNSNRQIVLSGEKEAIESCSALLNKKGIKNRLLPTSHPFHSPVIAGSAAAFREKLTSIDLKDARITAWSNYTAMPYETGTEKMVGNLSSQLEAPVRFAEMIENMYNKGARLFIEVGAGSVQTRFVETILKDKAFVAVATVEKEKSSHITLLNSLAKMAIHGTALSLNYLFDGRALEEYDLNSPEKYNTSVWMINGGRARPLHGTIPGKGYNPGKFFSLKLDTGHTLSPVWNREPSGSILENYLSTLNHFIDSQKTIMLACLGVPASSQAQSHGAAYSRDDASENFRTKIVPVENPGHNTGLPNPGQSVSTPGQLSREAITALLLEKIMLRTGYPKDMIELNLDLESDLGIDSIKRMELLSGISGELGIMDNLDENASGNEEALELLQQVAKLKTVSEIAEWIFNAAQQLQKERNTPPVRQQSSSEAMPPVKKSKALTAEQIQYSLIQNISKATGYPESMIELNLDLESDLGIDSIKRMTLLTDLSKELGINMGDEMTAQASEESLHLLQEVASLKTVEEISKWIIRLLQDEDTGRETPVKQDKIGEPFRDLSSYVVSQYKPLYKLTAARPGKLKGVTEKGTFCVLHEKEADPAAFISGLKKTGLAVKAILYDEFDSSEARDMAGIICIAGNISGQRSEYKQFEQIFNIARMVDPAPLRFFAVIEYSDHPFVHDQVYISPGHISGIAGCMASLHWEWPSVNVILISEHDSSPNGQDKWADHLLYEMHRKKDEKTLIHLPVAYYQDNRYVRLIEKAGTAGKKEPYSLDITKDDLIVIVGGAKGITQWIASGLADKYKCNFAIIGRSKMPDPVMKEKVKGRSEKEIRENTIRELNGIAGPKEMEKKVQELLLAKSLAEGIADLERKASSVQYYSLDVLDKEGVGNCFNELVQRHGKIDGLIFGAGVIKDKFIKDKDPVLVRLVYDVKVSGFKNCMEAVLRATEGKIRFVISFSSLSATIGNRGQTDYAAANNALENLVMKYKMNCPAIKFISFAWGPWSGKGMIDQDLEKHLGKMGLYPIHKTSGVDYVLQKMDDIPVNETVIIAISERNTGEDLNFMDKVFSN